jgi:hypothetical protein
MKSAGNVPLEIHFTEVQTMLRCPREWEKQTCLDFPGAKTPKGYGTLRFQGKTVLAHRLIYDLFFGIPKGKHVLHRCDNPSCFRLSHLFVGSPKDNTDDMVSKGRAWWQKGTGVFPTKISTEEAARMRELSAEGLSTRKIASAIGRSKSAVWKVVSQ